MALIEIRLRPSGPWRAGHRTGDRERVDAVYHSDALYSAVTHAMSSLGWLDPWLDATARAVDGSAVRFSSLFPFIGDTRLIAPPRTSWPPSGAGKLYVKAAKLVPLDVARRGIVQESRWSVDGATECLLPAGMTAPFEVSMRSGAAVDRITGQTEPHRTACLEFAPNTGWWGLIELAMTYGKRVSNPLCACLQIPDSVVSARADGAGQPSPSSPTHRRCSTAKVTRARGGCSRSTRRTPMTRSTGRAAITPPQRVPGGPTASPVQ